jgi:hypothetical protein
MSIEIWNTEDLARQIASVLRGRGASWDTCADGHTEAERAELVLRVRVTPGLLVSVNNGEDQASLAITRPATNVIDYEMDAFSVVVHMLAIIFIFVARIRRCDKVRSCLLSLYCKQ